MNQIRELVDKYLEGGVSDSSIRLWCDGIWYRMEVQIPRIDELIRIDMVRCLPDDKGLRWIGPSWHDSWMLKDWLHDWTWYSANFVEFFDLPKVPSEVHKLRFLVTEYAGNFSAVVGQTVIDGNLKEIPQELMDSVTADGRSHELVLNWLSVALGEHFEQIFSEYPALCWGFLQSRGVEILFFPPMTALHLPSGLRYEISLVQENEPGNFVEAPLRRSEREALEHRLKKLLT